ncbi:MAG TPA: hypothetical protein VG845_13885, partial [Dehalococcoidia bacterium]|nr:hypothetical protein [Dehalococcoidia bacterium]
MYGFDKPTFSGGIAAELKRLREQDIVRVVDALVVHKNAQGDIRNIQISDLTPDQAAAFGGILGGLIGLGAGGQQGAERGVEAGMQAMSERGGHVFDPESWDVLEDIAND